ncbi:tRNA pseudouridine(38-40) synthase TruA [Pseudoduganella plicata]|uniref:tRNA pseudouridine synthase A n=1 Tax=Pseudoduganella plicata TaxID=321984 RepID=A0A4P7BC96_9BURK|nr:tRNA pseudouridine(38-40) synthase TruA [Pseudoduganella plicata]QBQ36261.1 tRNA pseudouridine(38-40) synthase TruA [Pseudoduganella plicata]GGY76518.1 tRNA pseudouridine synthase A [Pseudoduganella plicata]
MKRIALGVQYNGTDWQGYQVQPHGQTVQDKLEGAIEKFACVHIGTTCAGRTDAGVHALGQVVHFDTDLQREPHAWVRGINAFLPESIGVRWAKELHEVVAYGEAEFDPAADFHARFSARSRTYHYLLYNNAVRAPLLAGRAGFMHRPLDVERMREAVRPLIGTHDFSAFRASGCQAKTPVKEMHEIAIERHGDMILFTLRASAFLHHMVRNLVGALIYVGQGREDTEWLGELLAGRDRTVAAPTFMPDGLYLANIDYDPKWGLPQETPRILPAF